MAGHSKWAQIKRQKAVKDAKKGAAFARSSHEIMMAAKLGGPDPAGNFRLRTAIDRAKAEGMPNDNIARAIAKGSGQLGSDQLEAMVYEGYGPGGVAVMIETLTDNRNRTAGDIRSYFNKCDGNLGADGCVAWIFKEQGQIRINPSLGLTEETVFEKSLEAGASDFAVDDDQFVVYTEPVDLNQVCQALTDQQVPVASAEISREPTTTVSVTDREQAKRLLKLLDLLESQDDVQAVHANFEMDEALLESILQEKSGHALMLETVPNRLSVSAPIQTTSHLQAVHRFFQRLAENSPYAVMLGGGLSPTALNQSVIIGLAPRQVCRLDHQTLMIENLETKQQEQIQLISPEALFGYLRELQKHPILHRRWMGFLSYEFYRYCDPALWSLKPKTNPLTGKISAPDVQVPPQMPMVLLCEFSDILTLDLTTGQWQFSSEEQEQYKSLWQACLQDVSNDVQTHATISSHAIPISDRGEDKNKEHYFNEFSTSFSQPEFETAVNQIQDKIKAGEIYQANVSLCLQKSIDTDSPYFLYERLCHTNPSPFSGLLKTPGGYLISNSPERLVCGHSDKIETRPIAGTRGRGATADEDDRIADSLLNNEKERAEHLMLVDLLRNDLGRVCQAGSVEVDELLAIERYERVTHLVSNISGRLAEGLDMWDVLRSVFPGGTITGCPKVRCIEILDTIEPVRRDFYTGSLGWFDLNPKTGQRFDWNILIRSLWLTPISGSPLGYNARIHVGAGIVADSIGAHEYRECLRKAESILGVLYACDRTRQRHF